MLIKWLQMCPPLGTGPGAEEALSEPLHQRPLHLCGHTIVCLMRLLLLGIGQFPKSSSKRSCSKHCNVCVHVCVFYTGKPLIHRNRNWLWGLLLNWWRWVGPEGEKHFSKLLSLGCSCLLRALGLDPKGAKASSQPKRCIVMPLTAEHLGNVRRWVSWSWNRLLHTTRLASAGHEFTLLHHRTAVILNRKRVVPVPGTAGFLNDLEQDLSAALSRPSCVRF